MKVSLLLFCLFLSLFNVDINACTSIIVSGKASADGRPFIMKNRDSTDYSNFLCSYKGERYHYMAIVKSNSTLTRPRGVASGFNEAGFAIINTVANNLNGKDKDLANNLVVIRRALEICATLEDFENLLDSLPRPMRVNSNYGVLDAKGGCAYYETGNNGYVKFDVNDPKVAPDGYLIRSNFAVTGDSLLGVGYDRYDAMEHYVNRLAQKGKIRNEDVIRGASRYLFNGDTNENLFCSIPENDSIPSLYNATGYIPRIVTTSAMLIQGVIDGENPAKTVAWTIVGNPLTTVVLPVWLTGDGTLPEIVTKDKNGKSTLVEAGLTLKKRVFPSNHKGMIDQSKLLNKDGTGILQQIQPIEDEIYSKASLVTSAFIESDNPIDAICSFYDWFDGFVTEEYKKRFNLDL